LRVEGSEFRVLPVSGFGFRVSVLGFRVSGSGFRASGFRASSFGFPVPGLGFWASGFGLRVSGFGFRVSGFWFRVCGLWVSGFGFCQSVPLERKTRSDRGRAARRCCPQTPARRIISLLPIYTYMQSYEYVHIRLHVRLRGVLIDSGLVA